MTQRELDRLLQGLRRRGAAVRPGYFAGPPAGSAEEAEAATRLQAAVARPAGSARTRRTGGGWSLGDGAAVRALTGCRALLRRGETLPLDDRE